MDLLPAFAANADEINREQGGYRLLELMSLDGWHVALVAAVGGGVLVLACKPGLPEVRAQGESVSMIAVELFKEACAVSGYGRFQ